MYGRFSQLYDKAEMRNTTHPGGQYHYRRYLLKNSRKVSTRKAVKIGEVQFFFLMVFCLEQRFYWTEIFCRRQCVCWKPSVKQVKRKNITVIFMLSTGGCSVRVMKEFEEKSVKPIARSKETGSLKKSNPISLRKVLRDGMTGRLERQ